MTKHDAGDVLANVLENYVKSNPITIIKRRNVQDIAPLLQAWMNTLCFAVVPLWTGRGRGSVLSFNNCGKHVFIHSQSFFVENQSCGKVRISILTSSKALLVRVKINKKHFFFNFSPPTRYCCKLFCSYFQCHCQCWHDFMISFPFVLWIYLTWHTPA